MKIAAYMSDNAYEHLVEIAHDLGYVRSVSKTDRPRGLSAFVNTLGTYVWEDGRPEYLLGTGQWYDGTSERRERCLHLSSAAVQDLGNIALRHSIFPYKSQAPVANGFRREATIPVLYPVGSTPPGHTSVKALVGPVLEAIGLRYLRTQTMLARAPIDLYQGPSRRHHVRQRELAIARSDAL